MEKLLPAEPFVAEKHGKLEQKMEAHLQIFERKKASFVRHSSTCLVTNSNNCYVFVLNDSFLSINFSDRREQFASE